LGCKAHEADGLNPERAAFLQVSGSCNIGSHETVSAQENRPGAARRATMMNLVRVPYISIYMFAAAFVIAAQPRWARAQVRPGDFINWQNAYKVKDLVSPGQYLRVMNGMSLTIQPAERIDWPPPYREATEKYSSQVRLSPDGRSLLGYVAGEPFPMIDPNDPHAGAEIMWNVTFRPISSDDYDLRWFDGISVYWGRNAPYREI
jgi:hypothetical protein